jgi:hypothetical protein
VQRQVALVAQERLQRSPEHLSHLEEAEEAVVLPLARVLVALVAAVRVETTLLEQRGLRTRVAVREEQEAQRTVWLAVPVS